MVIVLIGFSVSLVPKADAGLACLLEIWLLLNKNLRSYKCWQKKYLDFVLHIGIHYCGYLYTRAKILCFFKYIIKTNTWKLKRSPIGDMIDSNGTWILGWYILESFNIRGDIFSAKGLTSSNCGIFKFLTGWRKIYQNFYIFRNFCKNLITFHERKVFWRPCLIKNKGLIVFQNCLL